MYINNKVFLVEILGKTNVCNLRCEYCDWEKFHYVPLSRKEMRAVQRNLKNTRKFVKAHYPDAQMIEYSGGEPFMYPEIVMELLDIFPDYWIRVITNATLVQREHIVRMAEHGKTFLAISLDGMTVEANHSRRLSASQLLKILENIELALSMGVPVMILCTLNEDNVNDFFSYIDFIYHRYGRYVDDGLLTLPAHVLTSYSVKHRSASSKQKESFKKLLKEVDNPIVTQIREHYESLYEYDREIQCSVHQWAASMHFLGDEIASTGNFTSYRCGMRGVGKIGTFNIASENKCDTFSAAMRKSMKTNFARYHCGCTVDWVAIDLVLAGVIPVQRAEKWFKLFQDENIKAWIERHKDDFSLVYTRLGKMKKPAMCKRILHTN